jgi:hypothetical protein
MAYDTKCFDLAEAFLEDEPTLQTENKKKALAQTIQTAIEEWIIWERDHAAAASVADAMVESEQALKRR